MAEAHCHVLHITEPSLRSFPSLAAIASATIVSLLRVAGGMVRGKPALNPVISDPAGRPNAGA